MQNTVEDSARSQSVSLGGSRRSATMITLVFVHGACVRDAAWWWSAMTEPLSRRGIATRAVPLASCGESGQGVGDLGDDIENCRRAIAQLDGPVVLCGHSYGGMVITDAAAEPKVSRLLYVTSVMPDVGQSQADLIGAEPAPWMRPGDDGTVGVDPEMIREFFLQDCDALTTGRALERLTRQAITAFNQSPGYIGWRDKPASYFVCTEDLATPAEVQRRRIRPGAHTVEFAAGHHPFLSRPEAFADSIEDEIARS
jgi:pimeloyl-ACP methyl ester carboxylesterase